MNQKKTKRNTQTKDNPQKMSESEALDAQAEALLEQQQSKDDEKQEKTKAVARTMIYALIAILAVTILFLLVGIIVPKFLEYSNTVATDCSTLSDAHISEHTCKEQKCSNSKKNRKCKLVSFKCYNWTMDVQYAVADTSVNSHLSATKPEKYLQLIQDQIKDFKV